MFQVALGAKICAGQARSPTLPISNSKPIGSPSNSVGWNPRAWRELLRRDDSESPEPTPFSVSENQRLVFLRLDRAGGGGSVAKAAMRDREHDASDSACWSLARFAALGATR